MAKFKKLKGFTLIELIIVMAITTIILLMVATIAKPISTLFNDSNEFDTQRTVAEEMNTYVCENLRYANVVHIYKDYKQLPTQVFDPVTLTWNDVNDYFKGKAGITIGDPAQEARYNLIVINNSDRDPDVLGTADYFGRIIRTKGWGITPYTAMGPNFYGKSNFRFDLSGTVNADKITITTYALEKDNTPSDPSDNKVGIKATGSAAFVNKGHASPSDYMLIDSGKASGANASGIQGNNTYILFSLPN